MDSGLSTASLFFACLSLLCVNPRRRPLLLVVYHALLMTGPLDYMVTSLILVAERQGVYLLVRSLHQCWWRHEVRSRLAELHTSPRSSIAEYRHQLHLSSWHSWAMHVSPLTGLADNVSISALTTPYVLGHPPLCLSCSYHERHQCQYGLSHMLGCR